MNTRRETTEPRPITRLRRRFHDHNWNRNTGWGVSCNDDVRQGYCNMDWFFFFVLALGIFAWYAWAERALVAFYCGTPSCSILTTVTVGRPPTIGRGRVLLTLIC